MHRPRFTLRTLLVSFVMINVSIFVIVNYCMIPNKDERGKRVVHIYLNVYRPDIR